MTCLTRVHRLVSVPSSTFLGHLAYLLQEYRKLLKIPKTVLTQCDASPCPTQVIFIELVVIASLPFMCGSTISDTEIGFDGNVTNLIAGIPAQSFLAIALTLLPKRTSTTLPLVPSPNPETTPPVCPFRSWQAVSNGFSLTVTILNDSGKDTRTEEYYRGCKLMLRARALKKFTGLYVAGVSAEGLWEGFEASERSIVESKEEKRTALRRVCPLAHRKRHSSRTHLFTCLLKQGCVLIKPSCNSLPRRSIMRTGCMTSDGAACDVCESCCSEDNRTRARAATAVSVGAELSECSCVRVFAKQNGVIW